MSKISDLPIYEQGTKEQKANKPKIEDVCDYLLTDLDLKYGMARLLELSNELKMKPSWVQINSFKCSYKGKPVVAYKIGENKYEQETKKNVLRITVYLAEKQDLDKVIHSLPDDMLTELLKREITHCGVCKPATCPYGGFGFDISGKKEYICSRFNYMCMNPTPEQFKIIEKYILLRRKYIDGKME